MNEHPTPLVVPVPTVLVVGCDEEVVPRLSAMLAPSGVGVRETNLIDLRNDSAQLRPVILLVDAELYDFDPEAFDMVAQDVAARLGIVGNAREAELTLKRMLSALSLRGDGPSSQRAPLSHRAPLSQRAPAPLSQRSPSQSGEEPTHKWSFSAEELGLGADGRG